ncbi:MAG: nucleoside triphosphate pyrophosphohydrolase [Vicinamibacterales bacterium]
MTSQSLADPPSAEAARQFARLIDIVAALRGPGGCPWDREQTIDSLKKYVLEEAYELIETIDQHDHEALREELGDYVFEAVLIAQVEHEMGHFSIAESVAAVADKLVRRHPHVFARAEGEPPLETAGQVRVRWEEMKAREREERGTTTRPATLLSGIPAALPALQRAYQIGARARSVGFDWDRASDVVEKIREEVEEVAEVVSGDTPVDAARAEEEMGDLLFSIANLSRQLGIEPEAALRRANDKFTRRFDAMETRIAGAGRRMTDLSKEELEAEWVIAKATPA